MQSKQYACALHSIHVCMVVVVVVVVEDWRVLDIIMDTA